MCFICLVPRTGYNKGYAFVNMTTAVAARRLHAHLHGHCWKAAGSSKICVVVHARLEVINRWGSVMIFHLRFVLFAIINSRRRRFNLVGIRIACRGWTRWWRTSLSRASRAAAAGSFCRCASSRHGTASARRRSTWWATYWDATGERCARRRPHV